VPTEKVFQIRKSRDGKTKRIAVERSFLPGYVMVQLNLSDNNSGEIIHALRSTPGVINFLEVDGNGREATPKPMPNHEVRRILNRLEEKHDEEVLPDVEYNVGETVKVMDGPFSGFSGTVQEVFDEKKKLNVMVKIFGRTTPIELNYVQVEKTVEQ
jgi:transcriptional antiterminator NusG